VEKTGLSPSGISKLIGVLINKGVVLEDVAVVRNRGRRAISLKLNENSIYSIGVRLARNYIKCGLFNAKGDLLDSARQDIVTKRLAETTTVLRNLIRGTLATAEQKGIDIFGIGISAPGPLFTFDGRLVLTSNYPEWQGFSVKSFIEEEFGLTTYVEHDANASVLAERWYGKGRDCSDLVYVVVDRGVGAGIFSNGVLYRGHQNIAGEIGHTSINFNGPQCECGQRGCLEMYCSSFSVMKEARGVYAEQQPPGWTSDMTIDNLFELANEGEEYAVKVVQQAGRFLGIGLVNLINTHNPERIILGDEMTRAGKVWFDAVISTVKAQTLPEVLKGTDIQVSDLAIEPAFLGTGVLVVSKAFERVSAL
jgi:predicted NBD/HSP70 family sugar kinase